MEKRKEFQTNETPVLLEIKSHYPQMNDAMQRIADYLVCPEHRSPYVTANELAEKSGVSTASVSRFVKLLGYRNFNEFRLKMAMEREHKDQQPKEGGELLYNGEAIGGTPYEICKTIFSKSICEIEETWNILDLETLEKIADLISAAKRIVVIGVGRSKITTEALFSRLYRIGYPILDFSDSHEIVNITSILEKGDLLVAVSNFGQSKAIVEGARRAKKHGAAVVGITSVKGSPLAECADYLMCSAYDYNADNSGKLYDPSSENVSQLVLVDCLYMLVARRNEKKNMTYFKRFSQEIASEHTK